MTIQYLWYADQGPLIYDDANAYPDLVLREASRAPQHYIEDEPTEAYHVVRLSGLTSKLVSTMATVDSKIASVVAAGGTDSVARSMAASAGALANAVDGVAWDAHGDAATALSKLASHGL